MTPEQFKSTVPKEVGARFLTKVDFSGDCWMWIAGKDHFGYGSFGGKCTRGVTTKAHRLSYIWAIGPIDKNKEMDHLCRNRACIRPDHLEAVSHRENVRRGEMSSMRAVRSGYCLKGLHKLGGDNCYPSNPGQCKACVIIRKGPGGSGREKYLARSRWYEANVRRRQTQIGRQFIAGKENQ